MSEAPDLYDTEAVTHSLTRRPGSLVCTEFLNPICYRKKVGEGRVNAKIPTLFIRIVSFLAVELLCFNWSKTQGSLKGGGKVSRPRISIPWDNRKYASVIWCYASNYPATQQIEKRVEPYYIIKPFQNQFSGVILASIQSYSQIKDQSVVTWRISFPHGLCMWL